MFTTRLATVADAEEITRHRRQMTLDIGYATLAQTDTMALHFLPWVQRKLEEGQYIGWLTADSGNQGDAASKPKIVAGAGLFLAEYAPHWQDENPVRAYLINFYVDAEFRHRGIANNLLRLAVDETRQRRIRVVTLHASPFGRPIYEKFGFESTDEMRFLNTFD